VEPPANLVEAMNLQMTAERRRRAVVAEAEGSKEAVILQAQGRLEAANLDAQARERLAEAEGRAVQLVADAAAGAGREALSYFIAEKYIRAVEALAANPSTKTLVVPLESASMAGGIAQAMAVLNQPPASR
jgi:regulator of protease activity HflC (stomatin/prohibitin superfamily)